MIEKLDIYTKSDCIDKINEVVDALNEIKEKLKPIIEERESEIKVYEEVMQNIKQDPYAEQRGWIGKLCKFWDFVYDNYYFDTLKGITDKGLFIGHNGSWEHCEPVKPDDDIIFKGE